MTLLSTSITSPLTTAADSLATLNFSTNLTALSRTQPELETALQNVDIEVTWTFGRDGSLTAMNPDGTWWAGCSLPLLASRAVLKSLETNNQVSCFLAPVHAGLLVAARERMGEDPALIAVVPDISTLRIILACHDFSADIQSHHLWFATGESWTNQLQSLFNAWPGLPTPARFIRTKLTADDVIEPMIADAQKVFAATLANRTQSVDVIRSTWIDASNRDGILLIAGSRFRLWDDGGEALRKALSRSSNVEIFDSDDPATASPLALATAARNCRDLIAANIFRCDAPNLVPPETRWITWLTRPQVPDAAATGARDVLLLVDPSWKSTALSAGWAADRIRIAGWPMKTRSETTTAKPLLAMIADTRVIELPRSIEDLSSHRILWDSIEAELSSSPLLIDKLETYLDDRCRRYAIKPDAIDRRAFIDGLIIPAYQQGLARLILRAGLPVKLHGTSWSELEEFRAHSAGPVVNRRGLLAAVDVATALLYAWPVRHVHPIESLGKPVVIPNGHRPEPFLRQIQAAIQTVGPLKSPSRNDVSTELLSLLKA